MECIIAFDLAGVNKGFVLIYMCFFFFFIWAVLFLQYSFHTLSVLSSLHYESALTHLKFIILVTSILNRRFKLLNYCLIGQATDWIIKKKIKLQFCHR